MEIPKAIERKLYRNLDALVAHMDAYTNKALSDDERVERKMDYVSFREELAEHIADLLEYRNVCEEKKARNVDAGYTIAVLATAKHLRKVKTERYEAPIEQEAAPLYPLVI
jgi:hypothetical protein